jgi:hypothetical protein
MQRTAVLWRASPARLLFALFALLLTSAVAVATGANFNSTSTNAGNVVTAGVIKLQNNTPGALLSVTKLMPGQSKTGSFSLKNIGDDAASSNIKFSGLVDTPGTGGGSLSGRLKVTMTLGGVPVDLDPGNAANDFAMLDQLNNRTIQLGPWGATSTRSYDIKVEFLDSGGANGSDNIYQGSSSQIDLGWELTS